ncbi:hypothetical protein [Streptomyces fructofermentans]|uniref:Uncharacterized protein n=1 Tax=Streptomyces fructofermentans TaxID=152141 RepID=A0A918NUI6_9ACTN|nr:hypothetical protein [Streptomyces fructofermentans]GGX96457.1 hypothetical protein GCM10010515_73730 [Streptomyces fructofermentans]
MSGVHGMLLAGELDDLGDSWIGMFQDWATKGLQAGLIVLVVVIMIQRFSLKAGIGGLLLMIIALGLYNSREDLSDVFEDEVKNPAKGAPAVPGIVRGADPVLRDSGAGSGW